MRLTSQLQFCIGFPILAVALAPYLWIVLLSFQRSADILSPGLSFDSGLTFENYTLLFEERQFGRYLLNSLIVGFFSTVLTLFVGTSAAYGFSRFKIPGGNVLFFYILATRMGPPVAYALPMYLIFDRIGIVNSYGAIILAHSTFNLVIVVWIMRSFFDEVPIEVEEAAYLDGCSRFRVYWSIALPMAAPGLATVGIFSFIFSWNELLFALTLAGGETRTLPVVIPSLALHTGTLWGQVGAACVIQTLPIILITFVMQKRLVQGLTFGAVKG